MSAFTPAARGVLDTSTVLLLPRIRDATSLPSEPVITAVTLAELSVGPLVASTDAERAARQVRLQQAQADVDSSSFVVPYPEKELSRVHFCQILQL